MVVFVALVLAACGGNVNENTEQGTSSMKESEISSTEIMSESSTETLTEMPGETSTETETETEQEGEKAGDAEKIVTLITELTNCYNFNNSPPKKAQHGDFPVAGL